MSVWRKEICAHLSALFIIEPGSPDVLVPMDHTKTGRIFPLFEGNCNRDQMSGGQMSGDGRQETEEVGGAERRGRQNPAPKLPKIPKIPMPLLRGAGESFPCRGVSTGAAPLKVLFFKRPCEDTTRSEEDCSHADRRGSADPRRGVGGRGGSAPYSRANAKIGAPKLALASAKPTLTVQVFAHEFPSPGFCLLSRHAAR
jgi:hypothetical protein